MESLTRFLQNTEMFEYFPDIILQREIIPFGYLREYPKGHFLIMPQQKVESFGIILSGKVHILHIFAGGIRCTALRISGTGNGNPGIRRPGTATDHAV